jgi:hypothetical protein
LAVFDLRLQISVRTGGHVRVYRPYAYGEDDSKDDCRQGQQEADDRLHWSAPRHNSLSLQRSGNVKQRNLLQRIVPVLPCVPRRPQCVVA